MTAYFITGSDTGCGKTYVTKLLVQYFQHNKINCIALKPVASGCEWMDGKWVNEDVEQLMDVNHTDLVINQWLFKQPISPHFAASDDNIRLDAQSVISFCQQPQFIHYDLQLIEGAGGLMVPLNEMETWIDMIKLANLQMIVVIGIRLGCINHALLLNEVIQSKNLPVAGWIANVIDAQTDKIEDNILAIQSRIDIPLIATVNYQASQLNTTSSMMKIL